jgi:peptidoglycan/LPS O-acetylase OafA/YrhL
MISDRMPAIKKSSPDTTHINRHLHALDGLRGVAALCVLFLHSAELLKFTYVPPSAGLAVDFFFLLSGYVLAFAYDQKLEAKDYSFVWFAKLRLIRLYPMLFLGTSLGVAVAILGHTPASPLLIIGSFLLFPVGFISAIQNPQAYPYNNPVWSLFFELAVNFIYGSRLGRCAMPILFSIVAASAVGLAVTSGVLKANSFQLIGFGSPRLFAAGVLRVCCSFWLGVALFRLGLSGKMRPIPLWLASVALLAALLTPISGLVYSFVAVLMIFPILVIGAANAHLTPFQVKICKLSGELSYPLYLLHQPVFRIVKNLPHLIHFAVAPAILFMGGSLASIAIAFAALHLVDIPVRGYLMRRFRRA